MKSEIYINRLRKDWTKFNKTKFQLSDVMVDYFREAEININFCFINIPFEGTSVRLRLNHDFEIRALGTIYTSWEDCYKNNPHACVFKNSISKVDDKGFPLINYVKEEDLFDVLRIIKLSYWVQDLLDAYIRPLGVEEILKEPRISNELKSILYSLPNVNLTNLLSKVDTYIHEATYNGGLNKGVNDLFKGVVMGEKITVLRTYDTSNDRQFCLPVSNNIKRAIDAAPSLLRIPKLLIPHVKEIRRQGEKFPIIYNIPQNSVEYKKKASSKLSPIGTSVYWSKMVSES